MFSSKLVSDRKGGGTGPCQWSLSFIHFVLTCAGGLSVVLVSISIAFCHIVSLDLDLCMVGLVHGSWSQLLLGVIVILHHVSLDLDLCGPCQ